MDILTLVMAIALLLMAIGITHKENGSLVILIGLTLSVGAVIVRLLLGGALIQTGIDLFRDCGISLLLAAAYMSIRKLGDRAYPFMILGVISLILSGLLLGTRYVWKSIWPQNTQSVLVELGPDDSIVEIEEILDEYADRWERAFPKVTLSEDIDLAQVYLVYVSERYVSEMMNVLRADLENIDHVELNLDIVLSPPIPGQLVEGASNNAFGNDPYASQQWALDAVQAHQAHSTLKDVRPVRKARVAILDTGVEADHEDLQAAYVTGVQDDTHGHGTHCAGLAGAVTNNGLGIASLNWEGRFIEILGFRALSATGQGSMEQISQAVIDATKAEADVISMSLGSKFSEAPRVLINAVEYALERGVIVTASAGNSNEDAISHFPSNIDGVIAVAAVDQNLVKAEFSNTVGSLSRPLAAPGVDLHSSYPGGSYRSMSGTSMATPVVAGLIGVMRSMNPYLTAEQVYKILHETGTEIADTPQVGHVVNARSALEHILGRGI